MIVRLSYKSLSFLFDPLFWCFSGQSCNFMDKSNSSKEVSEEVTRESLIALSYTAPEKETTARHLNGKLIGEALAGAVKVDGNDKYRSRLISISYLQSPDTKAPPVLPGESRV